MDLHETPLRAVYIHGASPVKKVRTLKLLDSFRHTTSYLRCTFVPGYLSYTICALLHSNQYNDTLRSFSTFGSYYKKLEISHFRLRIAGIFRRCADQTIRIA